MSKIMLDANRAKYLATAVLPAASKDDVTPTLTGAHLSIEKGNLRVVTTDRYRVHAVLLTLLGDYEDDFEVLLPRVALLWIQKNAAVFNRTSGGVYSPAVVIEVDEGRVTIRVREDKDITVADEITFTTAAIKGKFPPVMNLITAARDKEPIASEALFTPDLLASVRALGVDAHRALIKFTEGSGTKVGPVYIKVGDHAEALIQPHAAI